MKRPIFAEITLLLVTLIWGATFVLVQNAINILAPFSFNGIRFLIASVFLMAILIVFYRKQLQQLNGKIILAGVFLGFWLFLGYATQTMGLLYTTSSKAGFITGLSVVLVPVFSFLLFKQPPGKNTIFGVLIATAGLFLLTMTDVGGLNIGDGLTFICAVGFALQINFTDKYSSKFPTLLLTVIQIATVAILSLLSAFIFEDWKKSLDVHILFSHNVSAALLVTSIFATAIAFLIQTNFQKYTSATKVALIFSMEPVFAAITGYFWAHDRLSLSAVLGCLLIFSGMIISELPVHKLLILSKRHAFKDESI